MKYLLIIAIFCGIYAATQLPLKTNFTGRTYVNNEEVREKIKEVKKIQAFIRRFNPKAEAYAETFYDAGKKHNVDHRQLLAMAVLESTLFKADSCQHKGGFNSFGYNSNNTCFKNAEEAIFYVAETLSNGSYYRGKATSNQLCVWQQGNNISDCPYAVKAIKLINSI